MKVSIIVGNGLNYLIEDIIRNFDDSKYPDFSVTKNQIANSVKEITSLWTKFDELFQELKKKAPKLSEEELIRLIYSVLDIFSNIKIFEKVLKPEDIEKIKDVFGQFLIQKIREISDEFRQHEDTAGYKHLKKLFPTFGEQIKSIAEGAGITQLNFYTTNYDGILDTLLTGYPHGFIFKDGFSDKVDDNLLRLWAPFVFFETFTISHLHGSYKYTRQFGTTYKLRTNKQNDDPVMVFNNPDFKLEKINNDNILSEYYHNLSQDLKDKNRLIIIGNSMTNEPHIKAIIKNYYNIEGNTIYIASRNPSKIHDQIKDVYHYNVVLRKTEEIKTMDGLVVLLKDLMTHGR